MNLNGFSRYRSFGHKSILIVKKIYFEEIKKLTNFVRKMSEHADSRLGV